VFAPGAGGNFLAGVLTGLLNSNYSDINIAHSGSSHSDLKNDYLAMGRFIDNTFSSTGGKITYYKKQINDNLSKISHPMVSWTHDTTNIPLYRTLFPNSKIIVITQDTPNEKLAVTFMNVIKNILDDDVTTALPPEVFNQMRSSFKQLAVKPALKILSEHQLNLIFSESKYEPIVKYLYFQCMVNFYGLTHLLENVEKQMETEIIAFGVSNKTYDLFENITGDITLPYSYLSMNDVNKLLTVVADALGRDLTKLEKIFVENNFSKYRTKQNLDILLDPVAYYKQLKTQTYNMVKIGIA
jgi:hypothetical protein